MAFIKKVFKFKSVEVHGIKDKTEGNEADFTALPVFSMDGIEKNVSPNMFHSKVFPKSIHQQ